MNELGYGKDYQYSHNNTDTLHEQEFLPEEISGTRIFEPGNTKRELELRAYLKSVWKDKYGYWSSKKLRSFNEATIRIQKEYFWYNEADCYPNTIGLTTDRM